MFPAQEEEKFSELVKQGSARKSNGVQGGSVGLRRDPGLVLHFPSRTRFPADPVALGQQPKSPIVLPCRWKADRAEVRTGTQGWGSLRGTVPSQRGQAREWRAPQLYQEDEVDRYLEGAGMTSVREEQAEGEQQLSSRE